MKGKDYLNLNSYATAQNCYDAMVEMFEIDPSYSLKDGLKIAAVRYQMLLNGFESATLILSPRMSAMCSSQS